MARSLRGRLARTLGITAAVSVAATALITFGLVRRYANDSTVRELEEHGAAIAREAEGIDLSQARALRRLLLASGEQVAFVGPRGGIQSEDPAARQVARAVDLRGVLAGGRASGTVQIETGTFAYAAVPVAGPRAQTAAVVLARPVGLARDLWQPIALRVLIAAGLAALAAAALSNTIARRMTRPIRRVADATARVAAGDLTSRVPIEGSDEVADLAARFNAMAEGLAEARRREHEFLASVSHELRTPITSIRGYAEAIEDGAVAGPHVADAVGVIKGESVRLERLVQDVMDLARLGAKEFRLEIATVDLGATLHDAVRAHSAAATAAGVKLEADAPGELVVETDAARVRQIVSNLVENALRVTPSGGTIRVSGRPERGATVVEVSDTGPGIAESDLPHVFERSYLWARSRGVREVGTGLGLAIVRELAVALGGKLEVESKRGRGATFRLWISTAKT